MNYDLALKLKEAGYPQGNISVFISQKEAERFITSCQQLTRWGDGKWEIMPYTPSLEELLEACRDWFGDSREYARALEYDSFSRNWLITERNRLLEDEEEVVVGLTPTEAVANLWLKLNQKGE